MNTADNFVSENARSVIIKSHTKNLITDEYFIEWRLVTAYRNRTGIHWLTKRMTQKEAWAWITEHGLVIQYKKDDGVIWDTPERSFKADLKVTKTELNRLTYKNW